MGDTIINIEKLEVNLSGATFYLGCNVENNSVQITGEAAVGFSGPRLGSIAGADLPDGGSAVNQYIKALAERVRG